jgi:hypothetical protein
VASVLALLGAVALLGAMEKWKFQPTACSKGNPQKKTAYAQMFLRMAPTCFIDMSLVPEHKGIHFKKK